MLMRCLPSAIGAVDPTTLSLTGFWRSYGGSAPWAGTASTGTSGSNSLTAGTAPSAGTALNGFGTASFNGTFQQLNAPALSNLVATGSAGCPSSAWALVKLTSITTGCLFGTAGSNAWQLTLASSQIQFKIGPTPVSVVRAIAASAWQFITCRSDGSNAQVGVNEVPGSSGGSSTAAFTGTVTSTSVEMSGVNVSGPFITGTVAEFGITNFALSDAQFTGIKAYINSRYGLSL